MMKFYFFIVFISLPMVGDASVLTSSYIRTKVVKELVDCNTRIYNRNFITDMPVTSMKKCLMRCSFTDKCRRFMFDRENSLCTMFESGEECFTSENIDNKVCYRQRFHCNEATCTRCPVGYYGNACQNVIQDCTDGFNRAVVPRKQMMSYIQPSPTEAVLEVKCDFKFSGKTLIEHRDTLCQNVNFNRTWDEYVNGFGYKHGEYWLGLKHVYNILQNHYRFQLGFLLAVGPRPYQCTYDDFNLTNSNSDYRIYLGRFSDHHNFQLGNSMTGSSNINGRPFSAYDLDHTSHICPSRFQGGWWFVDDSVCSRANVIGRRIGTNLEDSWHWLDDMGSRTDYNEIQLRLFRL